MEYVSQNSPFSPIHIYIHISFLFGCKSAGNFTIRMESYVSPHHFPRHRLYDPLVFILSSLYTRGNFLLTRIYDAHDEVVEGKRAGYSTDGMKWNNKGREEGMGEIVGGSRRMNVWFYV